MRRLDPSVGMLDVRVAQSEPKRADSIYSDPRYLAFRAAVIQRAGFRCEHVENGIRCTRSRAGGHRMMADHIVELKDGGAPFDPGNGQCFCVQHNTLKGIKARAARLTRP